jgi:DNA-binding SARP family transcriptional activator
VELEIELLGLMSAKNGPSRQYIRGAKARAVLALLALNARQIVSCDELVDELWMECSLQDARNALQANVVRLRRQLQALISHSDKGQLVRTTGNGYLLDVPLSGIDAYRFQSLADYGRSLVTEQPAKAIGVLQSALNLWRGPALVDAGTGFRCRAATAGFEERQIAAKEDLVTALLSIGAERSAVPMLRQLVAHYPTQERFCEHLMVALYRCDRQAEALDAFHQMRQRLGEQGLKPNFPLRALYQAILEQDPALRAEPKLTPR